MNSVYTTHFEGWNPLESRALLDYLYRHSINENFTCRLRWEFRTLGHLGQSLHRPQRPQ